MRSFIILATLMACTKGGSSPDAAGSGERTLTLAANGATIDETLLATATVVSNQLGIMGSDNAGHQLAIALDADIGGAYMVGGTVVMTMQYSAGASTWMASASNTPTGSASMNVTTFTSTEIIGTFEGMLAPQGSASGTEMITSGTFDIVVN